MSVHRAPGAHDNATTSLDGKLLTVAHPEFDHARRAWNLAVDQRPAAIISPTCVEDVIAAVVAAQGARAAGGAAGHRTWCRSARIARRQHPAQDGSSS
jgi:hypothetical protein